MYDSILHASLIIKDTKQSLIFYHNILGLEIDSNRPENDISFTMSSSGRKALFCRDPDGNALEFIQKPYTLRKPSNSPTLP